MKVENVFKIAVPDTDVRAYLASQGWEFHGVDRESEMDSYRNGETGRLLLIEDISDDFPVTFLMGELSLEEFGRIARSLTPQTELLEVQSSWEGRPSTIVVAMSEEQVRSMFGSRTRMKQLRLNQVASKA